VFSWIGMLCGGARFCHLSWPVVLVALSLALLSWLLAPVAVWIDVLAPSLVIQPVLVVETVGIPSLVEVWRGVGDSCHPKHLI